MSNSHVITNHISKINCIIIALLPIFVWYKPNASFITGHQYLISHLQDVYFKHVLVFSLVKMVFSKCFYMLIRKISCHDQDIYNHLYFYHHNFGFTFDLILQHMNLRQSALRKWLARVL